MSEGMTRLERRRRRGGGVGGFTLIEAMVLLAVLSVVAVGVGVGLQSATKVPEATDRALAISTELNSELDYWRAAAFGPSPWPASLGYTLTDSVTLNIGGQALTYSRVTSIQNWDPNDLTNGSSPKTDFVKIQVTINGQSAVSYVTNTN